MLKKILTPALILLSLALSGCGNGTMKDIATKAEKARTKQQLEAALGQPQKFEKMSLPVLGTGESWTYEAKDGDVVFTIFNNKVEGVVTVAKKKKE